MGQGLSASVPKHRFGVVAVFLGDRGRDRLVVFVFAISQCGDQRHDHAGGETSPCSQLWLRPPSPNAFSSLCACSLTAPRQGRD